ncbi:MAG: MarC family protein [Proteobacteria bacterium]|nr:MarC family protein [Pseudomonadota bacterium]
MNQASTLFVGTLTTLLAIINPLEVMPVYLQLLSGHDRATHLRVARKACLYALLLLFFFLVFGTALLKVFDVPLSMVRIVGGIILMRIGFSLFDPSGGRSMVAPDPAASPEDICFVPLAMPLMFGPGAIATVMGMASHVSHPFENLLPVGAIAAAIVLTMFTTYLVLAFAPVIVGRIGPRGIDAATRIVGFFVAAIGVGLIFQGVVQALEPYRLGLAH